MLQVKLDQGLEMLSIFKKHEADMSILDDFYFYEERQKAMQQRKARQQQLQSHPACPRPLTAVDELQYSAPKTGDLTSQLSKTFAQVVRLEETRAAESHAAKSSSSTLGEGAPALATEDSKKPSTLEVTHSS